MKYFAAVVLIAASLLSAAVAIWAGEIRDYQLRVMRKNADPNGRVFRWQQAFMNQPSYVFSFRIAGGLGAVFLLALAVQVIIYN